MDDTPKDIPPFSTPPPKAPSPLDPGSPAKTGVSGKPVPPATAGTPAKPVPVIKQPSRARRAFIRTLRWTLVLLIVFGAGIVLALYAWYLPAVGDLNEANLKISEVESQTNERITSLQAEAQSQSELQAQNQELKKELAQSQLHVTILSARADVAAAQLALVQKDPTKARLALSKTGETLETLEPLLQPEQAALAADLQNRLKMALAEIDKNQNAAESDLNVLATDLLELDNAYFAKP